MTSVVSIIALVCACMAAAVPATLTSEHRAPVRVFSMNSGASFVTFENALGYLPPLSALSFGGRATSTLLRSPFEAISGYEQSTGNLLLIMDESTGGMGVQNGNFGLALTDGRTFLKGPALDGLQSIHMWFEATSPQAAVLRNTVVVNPAGTTGTASFQDRYWLIEGNRFKSYGSVRPSIQEAWLPQFDRDGCKFRFNASGQYDLVSKGTGESVVPLVSLGALRAVTNGVLGQPGVRFSCKQAGNSYLFWVNSGASIDDGITYSVQPGSQPKPLFHSYPRVVTKHYLVFAQENRSHTKVDGYMVVRTP